MSPEVKQLLGRLNDAAIRSLFSYLNERHDSRITFLQIGGNDGKRGDPVNSFCKRFSWKGVIAEPVPEYFEKLSREYQDSAGVYCENVAISSKSGEMTIYFVPFSEVPSEKPWEQGLASLDREHLLQNGVGQDRIREATVPVLSVSNLLDRYKAINLSLVVIDVEGHEAEILNSFPWEDTVPECVVFESKHLSDDEHLKAAEMLKKFGYSNFRMLNDTVCIQRPPQWLNVHLTEMQRLSK